MVYSNEEIELTLNFYSIAKVHIDNLNQAIKFKELNDHEKNEYMFYSHIVSKVNYWLKALLPDELEIIALRNFENKTFDLISIHVGYANHIVCYEMTIVKRKYHISLGISLIFVLFCFF